MRVMARKIAGRISRYRFGMQARYALPIVSTTVGTYTLDGCPGGIESENGWRALSPEQQQLARTAQTTSLARITTMDGQPVPDDPASPIIVMGHSYVENFREQVVKELNLPIRTRRASEATTRILSNFPRAGFAR
jgi:hypothetical protein